MLYSKIKNFLWNNKYTIILFCSLFLYTNECLAANSAVFGSLTNAGKTIFGGLRKVVYPAATIGISCVCIAGMFGNFNWKWFIAILLGVFIIAFAEQTGGLATGEEAVCFEGDC